MAFRRKIDWFFWCWDELECFYLLFLHSWYLVSGLPFHVIILKGFLSISLRQLSTWLWCRSGAHCRIICSTTSFRPSTFDPEIPNQILSVTVRSWSVLTEPRPESHGPAVVWRGFQNKNSNIQFSFEFGPFFVRDIWFSSYIMKAKA